MMHDTSASARALATRVPTRNDLSPLRLPGRGADEPGVMRGFWGLGEDERREILAGGSFER